MKSISALKMENPIFSIPAVKIQQEILDHPRKVKDYHFCRSQPKQRHNPQLFGLSKSALQLLGIDYESAKTHPDSPFYLSGSKLFEESKPITHNYCGYQFGSWAGQLGDGRAHILGSLRNQQKLFQFQLKGSGITPFSRFADGNSVLSSALRQFLASELMAGLNIPTTRAASLVVADEPVKRDPFYNGKIKMERAAIVLRICQTFIRFGSLQVCLPDGQMRRSQPLENRRLLEPLCAHVIAQHYPDINYEQTDPYQQLYKRLVQRSAELVAYWQSIGFVHGVLNTDNMSMGGLTIDYGPFAFIDYFSKDYVSNATDEHERYSYRRQPSIIEWNLERLAQAMDPLFPENIAFRYLKINFTQFYNAKYYSLMSDKLGITNSEEGHKLIDELIQNMHVCGTHFTNFFRIVQENSDLSKSPDQFVHQIVSQSEPTEFYLKNLRAFPQLIGAKANQMLRHDSGFNVQFIEQQWMRLQMMERLRNEDCKSRNARETELWLKWAIRYWPLRQISKDKVIANPKYVLLNVIAKQITQNLQKMSASESRAQLQKILSVFENPFKANEWFEETYWKKMPVPVKLTCSS